MSAQVSTPHVVILGGGFAGLAAARTLRRAPVRITLIDRRNHHLFQPLLYQVATASLSPGDIAAPIRWILRRQANVHVLLAEATSVDTARRVVHLDGAHEVNYDYLIVCTGVTHSYFGHNEWEPYAPGLKSLEDALEIRRRVLLAFERAERESNPSLQRQYLTFVVVGGGPTGVEMAGALAEIARQTLRDEFREVEPEAARIVLIEAGPTILGSFEKPLRESARRSLRKLGVEIWENTMVTAVEHGVVRLGDERVPARTIVWAAGVVGSPLGASLGVPLDRVGRVIVEPDLSVPGHPEVFVVGDLACATHQTGEPLPGVAQVAKQGARSVAKNIIRRLKGEPAVPFVYWDLGSMATVGRAKAIAELGWVRLTGFVAWLAWLVVHLVTLIGFKNKVFVMINWGGAYISFQRGVRLITGKDVLRSETVLVSSTTGAAAPAPDPATPPSDVRLPEPAAR
ncbi:MAG: NAD(P)/FAD-dependent oxidoreductase [Vicinamibacterales bacterium]